MINFQYSRVNNVADAVRQIAANPKARFIAGGTNLIDLMKEEVERPSRLIDITHLPLKAVEETAEGGLRKLMQKSGLKCQAYIHTRATTSRISPFNYALPMNCGSWRITMIHPSANWRRGGAASIPHLQCAVISNAL
jgi:hypothetical protein